MASAKAKSRARGPANRFRIIAGRWRGRRLEFVPGPSLRPTPDRVRETLFNWLAPLMPGARCLDLFAGSGALGLEALSRGAGSAVFVDNDRKACERIHEHLDLLGCDDGEVLTMNAGAFLARSAERFDIVFLDPPFASGLCGELCTLLVSGGWLAPAARVYVEYPRTEPPVTDPVCRTLRTARAGRVEYALLALR